ncbi:hypothetical protein HDU96_009095 [Phlyctochytrium bullatum]|nr:hypothetical protein HDU96_009095 [Phlyctochytrium bullatum]
MDQSDTTTTSTTSTSTTTTATTTTTTTTTTHSPIKIVLPAPPLKRPSPAEPQDHQVKQRKLKDSIRSPRHNLKLANDHRPRFAMPFDEYLNQLLDNLWHFVRTQPVHRLPNPPAFSDASLHPTLVRRAKTAVTRGSTWTVWVSTALKDKFAHTKDTFARKWTHAEFVELLLLVKEGGSDIPVVEEVPPPSAQPAEEEAPVAARRRKIARAPRLASESIATPPSSGAPRRRGRPRKHNPDAVPVATAASVPPPADEKASPPAQPPTPTPAEEKASEAIRPPTPTPSPAA